MSQVTKDRVNENFKMINEILQRNKSQLNELNKNSVAVTRRLHR